MKEYRCEQQDHMIMTSAEKRGVGLKGRFGFGDDEEYDNGWLVSMSDLMSMLLVFFLVITALNSGAFEPDGQKGVKGAVPVVADSSHSPESRKSRGTVYEIFPSGGKHNYVLVAFDESHLNGAEKKQHVRHGGVSAVAKLVPVDLQVVSLQ